jgi:hypothetical protein
MLASGSAGYRVTAPAVSPSPCAGLPILGIFPPKNTKWRALGNLGTNICMGISEVNDEILFHGKFLRIKGYSFSNFCRLLFVHSVNVPVTKPTLY